MRTIPSSELIINDDGSIFHLHLKPEQLADIVILVGDPGRVAMVASFFDTQECSVSNREFNTVTGTYKGKRMTVLSTGIGIGNIDISVTELDALANVDFATRQEKAQKRQLTLVRLGTSGAIQPDIKVGQFVFARTSVGFDGLLNYYKGHLKPEQLADIVILVGDPGRVAMVASFFDTQECSVSNREFNTVTGTYKGKRMTVLSTGIGIGNIDISVTELDALANVDFATRQEKAQKRQLTLVRLGTSGAIQPDIKVGQFVFARTSVGFDGLLNYYKGRNEVCDLEIEKAFMKHTGWSDLLPKPYFIDADPSLAELFRDVTIEGITIAAPGFYAPQGRWVRLEPADIHLNEKIESFDYHGRRVTNFEMESSALAGLAALMGHKAATICTIIAQRIALDACTDYKPFVRKMIQTALDKLATL